MRAVTEAMTATAARMREDFLDAVSASAGLRSPAIIEVVGAIDEEAVKAVSAQLEKAADADEILLDIDCSGGALGACAGILTAIRAHKAEKKVAGIWRAESGGVLISLGAHRRIAHPEAKILLHHTATDAPEPVRWTSAQHLEQAKALHEIDLELASLIGAVTGRPAAIFYIEGEDETHSTVEWAIRAGIIHSTAGGRA